MEKKRADKKLNVAIATPTYNESANIPLLIAALSKVCSQHKAIDFSLLVIDDNSPDGTANIAEAAGKKLKRGNLTVNVLRRKGKEGFGKAYVHGFKEILKTDPDYILQMDADLSHNPEYLTQFIEAIEKGHDFIVASRYISGGGTPDWGLHRKVLSRGGNFYTRLFLGSKITDYTGGFNMFSAELLRELDLDSLRAGGYGFLIELKYRALKHAKKPTQVAIVFMDREHGTSKIPKSTLFKNLVLVPRIRFNKNDK